MWRINLTLNERKRRRKAGGDRGASDANELKETSEKGKARREKIKWGDA